MKADEIRILVIEDNPNWVNKTRQILRHLGYANVRTAANAEEARATFKEFDPHLAVVDIMLPEDEDGFDLIKEMRDADPRMHIIAVSALESSDYKSFGIRAGADDYIVENKTCFPLFEQTMKYTYAYKDSDGKRHEAAIEAPSRDAAFAALREQGIRPIKVVAADGSKANGAPVGVRRRVMAVSIIVAVVAAVGATVAFLSIVRPTPEIEAFHEDQTRRYPIGDAAIIEKGILTGWSDVFEHEGDRFLASFAVPGVKAAQRNTTVEEIESALERSVPIANDDGLEARQIKAMVASMKHGIFGDRPLQES